MDRKQNTETLPTEGSMLSSFFEATTDALHVELT